MKHTQGEWQIEFSKTGYDVFASAEHIASIKRTVNNEQEANAKLIAAAPDMINALIFIEDYVKRELAIFHEDVPQQHADFILKNVRNAIEKAIE